MSNLKLVSILIARNVCSVSISFAMHVEFSSANEIADPFKAL